MKKIYKIFALSLIFTCSGTACSFNDSQPLLDDIPFNEPEYSIDITPSKVDTNLTSCLNDSSCYKDMPIKAPVSSLIGDWTIYGDEEKLTVNCSTIFPFSLNNLPLFFDVRISNNGCYIPYLQDFDQVLDEVSGD